METRQIHIRDLSTVTGIQQIEHAVQSIYFLGLEDFEGDVYISIESDDYSNEAIPLMNNTFIIGQPMTLYNTTYTCQIYGVVNDGEKIKLSKRFRLIVDKSNNIQGDSSQYPVDPNFENSIIEFVNEQKSGIATYTDDKIDEIQATGDAVIASIPSDYTALEQATYNAYPCESESGNPIYFDDGAKDIPVKELIVNFEPIQIGSGDPSPTNVRPITGVDGMTVKRFGKNVLEDGASGDRTVYGITKETLSDGSVHVYGTNTSASASAWFDLGSFNAENGKEYYYGGFPNDMTNYTFFATRYGSTGNFYSDSSFRFSSDVEAKPRIYVRPNVTVDITFTPVVCAIEDMQEYYIAFPSSADIVYGGSLNVTTGVLTVDRAIATITDVSQMNKGGATNVDEFYMISPSPWGKTGTLYGADNIVCSHATSLASGSTTQIFTRVDGGQPRIVFPLSEGINSLSAFETWLNEQTNPLQFAYRIAEPLTYQLTPTEVSTLLMGNTFMSDGEINLTYRQDTNTVIDRLVNAIISMGGNV